MAEMMMKKRLTFVPAVVALVSAALLCVAASMPRAVEARRPALRLVTREVSLGRVHPGELKGTRTVSPDRRRVAFVAKVTGGEAAYVDGVAGKTYPAVASDPLSEAGLGSPFTFSPDGRRVAYVAHLSPASSRARGPRRVVVDGNEGTVFDYVWSGAPHFSKDGKRFAYTAERGGKRFAVVDGVESKPYDLVRTPAFSGDGSHAAFEAVRDGQTLFVVDGREFAADDAEGQAQFHVGTERAPHVVERDGKRFVVWRDKQSGPFDEVSEYTLNTAGGRVTFVARRGGKEFAVVDGKESKPYDSVRQLTVSPKGGRVLFAAREGEASLVVVDDVEGARYDSVDIEYDSPFSPDGAHYAHKATREGGDDSRRSFVVADGKEGKGYDYTDHVVYTPDGAHLLYLAYGRAQGKTFLVRDGEEVAAYDNLPDYGGFRFSPDGKRMFFRLQKLDAGKEAIVVDGRAFHYDEITDAEFGPDGRRFVFKAQRGGVWVMVIDGTESEAYEPDGDERGKIGWSRDGRLAFSKDGSRVAYVGRKGGKDFVVADGAAGARYDAIGNLAFTPDGRHVVYTARRGGKSLLVVDGAEGREYEGFLPVNSHEREGRLNVEGTNSLSILASRGTELLRVEVEIVEG
jgi:hypothetical protein